jgi:hypothetical protein
VLNHGFTQLRQRFSRSRHVTGLELQPQRSTSLELEPGFLEFAASSRMVVPETYVRPVNLAEFRAAPTIIGAVVANSGSGKQLQVDPNTILPEEGAPGLPRNTDIREVRVYAKATVSDPMLGDSTAYVRKTFQVLDGSMYQNTVYFNGLLEIFPGGGFNLGAGGGPIYGSDIRIGNNTRVHTRIETPGDFRVGRYHNSRDTGDDAKLTDFDRYDGAVPSNPDKVGYLGGLKAANTNSGDSRALQTGVDGFRNLAENAFNGGLMTGEHGIEAQSAVGLDFMREFALKVADANGEDYTTDGVFDQGKYDREGANFGHLLIEPSRGKLNADEVGISTPERERRQAMNSIEERKWANLSSLAIELDPATNSIRMYHQPMNVDDNERPVFDNSGNRQREEIVMSQLSQPFDDDSQFWTVEPFSQPGGGENDVEGGIYDFRQAKGNTNRDDGRINLLKLDMGKMRRWVEESWDSADLPSGVKPEFRDEWWNGGVYIKLPEQSDPSRSDGIIPAVDNWAVQLQNGETIPNRYVVDDTAPRGMTVATNGAMYVEGTFNAPDGTTWDKDAYATDAGAEVPAALVADAIMLLSDKWDNRTSAKKDRNSEDDGRRAVSTTYSAALVTGNVPSDSGKYSGGIENYPRLLEKWSGRTLTYRGSLVRLFRSESFTARWGYGNVYDAANRNWSFHTGYRTFSPVPDQGQRDFRRVYYKELTRSQFEAETADIFTVN